MDKNITALKDVSRDNSVSFDFSWSENAAVQKLLDVVVEILAEEYIEIAKHNPGTFSRTPMNTDTIKYR